MKRQSLWLLAIFIGVWFTVDVALEAMTDEIAEVIGQSQVKKTHFRQELDSK